MGQICLYIHISSAVLYLVTLILGKNINGAVNWIVIGGFSFQPAELCKILFVFFLASYFKNPDNLFLGERIRMRGLECFKQSAFDACCLLQHWFSCPSEGAWDCSFVVHHISCCCLCFLQGFKNVFVKFRFYSSRCNFGVF